jgi:hypothetical protein
MLNRALYNVPENRTLPGRNIDIPIWIKVPVRCVLFNISRSGGAFRPAPSHRCRMNSYSKSQQTWIVGAENLAQ